ncbi:MAG: tetratricopeptide repeat protein [Thermodesulfobacteriota bacterium]
MAKITPKRRVALDSPDAMLTWAQLLLERLKPFIKWLVLVTVVIAVGLGAWGIKARMQASREEKAATALAQVTPKIDLNIPALAAATDLEKFIKEYPGTAAAREAQLLRANILYGLQQYSEAAKAYESLLDGRDPAWDNLITESLSYCYEGMGNYQKAAEVLKPLVEKTYGPLQIEVIHRLALLHEQAKEPGQAAVYWRKLLEKPPDAAMVPYLQEKLAAAEAGSKK